MSSAAALFVNPAFSQKTDDKPEEDEVIKLSTFSVSTDAYHGYVASSTLIGGKTAQKITDVPQTVSVVTRDLIDDIGAVTPQEALNRLVPGVSVVSRQGSSSAGTYIRGFRVQNWAVDGATMRALDTLSTFNVDAIEVIKGPASVTFGAFAAYGGYVSILPKYAHRNQKNKVQFDVGTDNFYSGMIDIGDELGKDGDFQYRLVLGSLSSDRAGWEYDFDKSLTIAPSFAYDFSENNRVRVRFAITETDTKNSTTALDINGNVVKGFSSNGPSDEYHNEEQGYSTQMVWETELNDEWSTKMNIFGARGHIDWMGNNLRSSTTLAQDYFVNPYKRDYTWTNFYVDYSVSFKKDEIANTGISYQAVGSLSMDHWNNHYTLWDVNQYAPWSGYKIDPTNPNWALLPTSSELLFPTRYIYYNTEWLGGAVIENVVGLFKDKLLLSAAIRFNYDNRSSHTAWREPRTNAPGGTYVGDPTPPTSTRRPPNDSVSSTNPPTRCPSMPGPRKPSSQSGQSSKLTAAVWIPRRARTKKSASNSISLRPSAAISPSPEPCSASTWSTSGAATRTMPVSSCRMGRRKVTVSTPSFPTRVKSSRSSPVTSKPTIRTTNSPACAG